MTQRPIFYCVGCGDPVSSWPCPRCGHKYIVLTQPVVQLRLFYPERAR